MPIGWDTLRGTVTLSVVAASVFATQVASADVASWMLVGGGGASVPEPSLESTRIAGTLQLDAGFGSDPNRDWVVGGVARTLTFFGAGTDLSLLLRTSSGGFARGDWGLALDLGPYQRWWGPDRTGLQVSLNGGGPWGLTLGATGGSTAKVKV